MEAVQFLNFSDEDFTWKFDGIAYTFKAGQTIFLENFKADHFAGHLVDRELDKLGHSTGKSNLRNELLAKCFPSVEVITPLEAMQVNEKAKVKKAKVEVEFEDLSDNKK